VALPADLNQEVDLSVIGFRRKMKASTLQALQQSRQGGAAKLPGAGARKTEARRGAEARGVWRAQVARIAQLQGVQSGVRFAPWPIKSFRSKRTRHRRPAADARLTPGHASFRAPAGRSRSTAATAAWWRLARRGARAAVGSIGAVKTTSLKRFGTTAVFATLPVNTLPAAGVDTPVAISAGSSGKFVGVGVAAPAQAGINTVTLAAPFKQREVLNQFSAAFSDYAKIWTDPHAAASVHITPVDFPLAAAAAAARIQVDPTRVVPARISSLLTLAESPLKLDKLTGLPVSPFVGLRLSELADSALRYAIPRTFDRVMAYPRLDMPTYEYLARYDKNVFLPGVDQIPQDFILLLQTNLRFIESFMVGLNHDGARTQARFSYRQRGTPFRRFWTPAAAQRDTPPTDIDLFICGTAPFVSAISTVTARMGKTGWCCWYAPVQRFPNTIVYANQKGPTIPCSNRSPPTRRTSSSAADVYGRLEPVVFFGFPIRRALPQWCFVLAEHDRTAFRLRRTVAGQGALKSGPGGAKDSSSWKDAIADLTVAPGQHFSLQQMLNDQPLTGPGSVRFEPRRESPASCTAVPRLLHR
jgi:hypothetical protein